MTGVKGQTVITLSCGTHNTRKLRGEGEMKSIVVEFSQHPTGYVLEKCEHCDVKAVR